MAPSSAFKAAWLKPGRSARTLARIVLPSADGLSFARVYASHSQVVTPPGTSVGVTLASQAWGSAIIDCSGVFAPGGLLNSDPSLCNTSIRLNPDYLVDGVRLRDLATSHVWLGSKIQLWLWEESLSSFNDALPTLANGTIQSVSFGYDAIELQVRQRIGWNAPITTRKVTRDEFPNANEQVVGASLPVRIGRQVQPGMRRPWQPFSNLHTGALNIYPMSSFTGSYTGVNGASHAIGEFINGGIAAQFAGNAAYPCIVTDPGPGLAGTNPARIYLSGHRLKSFGSSSTGTPLMLSVEGEREPSIALTSMLTAFNDDNGAGFIVPDSAPYAVVAYPCTTTVNYQLGSVPPANAAMNVGVMAQLDETKYWEIAAYPGAVATSNRYYAQSRFNVGERLGVPIAYAIAVCHQIPSTLSVRAVGFASVPDEVAEDRRAPGANWQLPASTTPIISCVAFNPVHYNASYGETGADAKDWPVSGSAGIAFVGASGTGAQANQPGGSGIGRIYGAFLLVQYTPTDNVFDTGTMVEKMVPDPSTRKGRSAWEERQPPASRTVYVQGPPMVSLKANFWANSEGYPDDAAGKYTGTPNACISRPPDAMRFVLERFGGESPSNITTGVGEFGSFVDARTACRSWRANDMVAGMTIDSDTDVSDVIGSLMSSFMSWCHLSPWDDKWKVIPQYRGMPITWSESVPVAAMTQSPTATLLPDSRISTSLSLPYLYDGITGQYLSTVSLSASSSNAGRDFDSNRYESLLVEAGLSDRMDLYKAGGTIYQDGSGVSGFKLTAGNHDYQSIYNALKPLQAASGSSLSNFWLPHAPYFSFAFGGIIRSGNSRIGYRVNATTPKFFEIPHGDYTMESLANTVTALFNGDATVSYSRATKKFTIVAKVSGFRLDPAVANNPLGVWSEENGFAALGLFPMYREVTTLQSDFPVEERFFCIAADTEFTWRIASGANGSRSPVSRQCGGVLGFNRYADPTAISAFFPDPLTGGKTCTAYSGDAPKGHREMSLLQATQRHINSAAVQNNRRTTTLDGKAISDGDTAIEVISRAADLLGRPIIEVRFAAYETIGIERGMVFEFGSDMDARIPYPNPDSDGSWVGKRFMVTETEQRHGPAAFDTSVVAVSVS